MKTAFVIYTLTALVAVGSPALGGVIQLPATGQISAQLAGDDGALLKGAVWPTPRFAVNADQTVSDTLTGLMWPADGNVPAPAGLCGGPGVKRTWSQALNYVACLNSSLYLGFTDWRLPNITELASLINAGQADVTIWLASQGISAIQNSYYWSATSDAALPADFAWSVQLGSGASSSDDKTVANPVIPVRRGSPVEPLPAYAGNTRRSGQTVSQATGDDGALRYGVDWPAARFTTPSSGSGVVYDNLTRLVWLKDASTPTVAACTGGPVNWPQALTYLNCLNGINYQGRSDWRLPNRVELESLVDYAASGPALQAAHPFTGLAGSFWSSSSDAADAANSAWYLTISDGSLFSSFKTAAINVWPVSGPDTFTSLPLRTVALPRTGQLISGAAGDDGLLQSGLPWPSIRFSDAGQSLVDTLTGLEWSKDANAPAAGAVSCQPLNGASMTWQEALDYVACLNQNSFLGHSDWRLPNVNELESLSDAGAVDGTVSLITQGFTTVKNDYWSSSSDVAGVTTPGDSAWTVRVASGEVFSLTKDPLTMLSVWPVRSAVSSAPALLWQSGQSICYDSAGTPITCAATGQDGQLQVGVPWPLPRLIATADLSVSDALTGLIWPQAADTPTIGVCTGGIQGWDSALTYVTCLNTANYLGYSDWRLPNRKELRSLVNYAASQPALPAGHPFTGVSGNYWSSTGSANDATKAVSVNLAFSDQSEFKKANSFAVLPVRGGQNITVDRAYLDFGTPALHSAAVDVPVVIHNSGIRDLTLGAAAVNGASSSFYAVSATTCSGTLSPGASCSLTIRFDPTAEGFKEAGLTLVSNDPDSPSLRLPLTGIVPDVQAPLVAITTPAAGYTNNRATLLSFSASDGYIRVFMNGVMVDAVSGTPLPALQDGVNTVRVEATDVAGNSAAAQTVVTFVLPSGELDGSAGVSIADALIALRISVGLQPQPTGQLLFSGDVAPFINGVPSPDGTIDIADALTILRKIVGLITL